MEDNHIISAVTGVPVEKIRKCKERDLKLHKQLQKLAYLIGIVSKNDKELLQILSAVICSLIRPLDKRCRCEVLLNVLHIINEPKFDNLDNLIKKFEGDKNVNNNIRRNKDFS